MRPGAVVAVSFFEEAHDFEHAVHALLTRNEAALHAYNERHNSEAASTGSDDAVVTWKTFEGHSGIRVRAFPVVAKASFLNHGQQFLVVHRVRGSGHRFG